MSHLKLTTIQKQRRAKYVSGGLKAKPLANTSREQQKAASKKALADSLNVSELIFV